MARMRWPKYLKVGVFAVCLFLICSVCRLQTRSGNLQPTTFFAHKCIPARLNTTDYYHQMSQYYPSMLLPQPLDGYDCAYNSGDGLPPGRSDKKSWSQDFPVRQRISLCFILESLILGDPADFWFWHNLETVFLQAPFTVFSVRLGAHSPASAAALASLLVSINQPDEDLWRQCDVLMYRGTAPLISMHQQTHRIVPHILVVADPEDLLPANSSRFDAIITTVPDPTTLPALAPNASHAVSRLTTIPMGLPLCEQYAYKASNLDKSANPSTKVLTYYGSLNNKRDVDFFLAVLHALPDDWVGVAWHLSATRLHPQSHALQQDVRINQSLAKGMQHIHLDGVALLPDAGTHFQWLQNWEWGVPIFARSVLWAKQYPEGVFLVPNDEAPESVARRMRDVIRSIREGHSDLTVQNGRAIFQQNFCLICTARTWVRSILDVKTDLAKQMNVVEVRSFRLFRQVQGSKFFSKNSGAVVESTRSGTRLNLDASLQIFAAADLRPYFQSSESDGCVTVVLEYTTEWAAAPKAGTFYIPIQGTSTDQPVKLKSTPLWGPSMMMRASEKLATLKNVPIRWLHGRRPAQLSAVIETCAATINVLRMMIMT